MDDLEWHMLDDKAAKVLVMLWVIASENDGNLPDTKTLAFRLRIKESEVINCCSMLSHWLEHDDIDVISKRYQGDTPERETERETETEVEKNPPRKRDARPAVKKPDDVEQQTWDDWQALRKAKRAPVTETVVNGARREAGKAGMTMDAFLQVWCRRGSQGLEADWLKPDERVSYAQQAADIARSTVPGKPGKDPALAKIEEDIQKAAPIPANIREKIAALKGTVLS